MIRAAKDQATEKGTAMRALQTMRGVLVQANKALLAACNVGLIVSDHGWAKGKGLPQP